MLFALGQLLGASTVTRHPMNVNFARAIWKTLAGETVTTLDAQSVDTLWGFLLAAIAKRLQKVTAPSSAKGDGGASGSASKEKRGGGETGREETAEEEDGDAAGRRPEEGGEGKSPTGGVLAEASKEGEEDGSKPPPLFPTAAEEEDERWGDLNFTSPDASGRVVELFLEGSKRAVEPREAHLRVWILLTSALKALEGRVAARLVAAGLAQLLPVPLVTAALSGSDLERLACGDREIDVDILKAHTKIRAEGPSGRCKKVLKWFWEVLREMSLEDRQNFLRFVCGRARLPVSWTLLKAGAPGASERAEGGNEPGETTGDRKRHFELLLLRDSDALESFSEDVLEMGMQVRGQTVDDRLPSASTCFFSLRLPLYSSKKILKERLTLAISLCTSIDLDGPPSESEGDSDVD